MDFSRATKLKNIGDYAFVNDKLTELDIPSGVTFGEYAFYQNLLVDVKIGPRENPESSTETKIGVFAFSNNLLENVELTGKVTLTGVDAFKNNQLPPEQAYIMGRDANGNKTGTLTSYGGADRGSVLFPDTITDVTATFSSLGISGTFNSGNGLTQYHNYLLQINNKVILEMQ